MLYRRPCGPAGPTADWAAVEQALSGRGVTLMLLWEEWREAHPDGISYPTWCRRFRAWRPRRDVTMRQNRRPGEKLFADHARMAVPLRLDGQEHPMQVISSICSLSTRSSTMSRCRSARAFGGSASSAGGRSSSSRPAAFLRSG